MKLLRDQFDEQAIKRQKKNGTRRFESDAAQRAADEASQQSALVSAKLKRELKAKDATSILKNEIKGSQLRVKAAKYGHRLEDIAPPYSDAFYLPDKSQYFINSKVKNNKNNQSRNETISNVNNTTQMSVTNNQNDTDEPSTILINNKNDTSTAFITEANNFLHH